MQASARIVDAAEGTIQRPRSAAPTPRNPAAVAASSTPVAVAAARRRTRDHRNTAPGARNTRSHQEAAVASHSPSLQTMTAAPAEQLESPSADEHPIHVARVGKSAGRTNRRPACPPKRYGAK